MAAILFFDGIATCLINNRDTMMWTAILSDNSCRQGAPRDATMGLVRETALASSTIFVISMENTNIHKVKLKCHVIIVVMTDLSDFIVKMHSGLCERHVQSLDPTASGLDFLFRTRLRAL